MISNKFVNPVRKAQLGKLSTLVSADKSFCRKVVECRAGNVGNHSDFQKVACYSDKDNEAILYVLYTDYTKYIEAFKIDFDNGFIKQFGSVDLLNEDVEDLLLGGSIAEFFKLDKHVLSSRVIDRFEDEEVLYPVSTDFIFKFDNIVISDFDILVSDDNVNFFEIASGKHISVESYNLVLDDNPDYVELVKQRILSSKDWIKAYFGTENYLISFSGYSIDGLNEVCGSMFTEHSELIPVI